MWHVYFMIPTQKIGQPKKMVRGHFLVFSGYKTCKTRGSLTGGMAFLYKHLDTKYFSDSKILVTFLIQNLDMIISNPVSLWTQTLEWGPPTIWTNVVQPLPN